MNRRNMELKDRIRKTGLTFWEVAEAAGITGNRLSIWLRDDPMPTDRRARIDAAIVKLTAEKANCETGGMRA